MFFSNKREKKLESIINKLWQERNKYRNENKYLSNELFKTIDKYIENKEKNEKIIDEQKTESISIISEMTKEFKGKFEEMLIGTESSKIDINELSNFIDEVASSMEELSSGSTQIMSSIERIKTMSIEINDHSKNAKENMKNEVKIVDTIKNNSERLNDIVNYLNNISAEIHNLSINTRIESAHAGEYGRGFAIISDNISELASNSDRKLKEIKVFTKNTIDSIDTNKELSKENMKRFESVDDMINELSAHMIESASAIIEQESVIANILRSTHEMREKIMNIKDVVELVVTTNEESIESLNFMN